MTDDAPHSLTSDDAREVLIGVARRDDFAEEYPRMAELCETPILEQIVDLAWRYQFVDDRSGFKREIRDLQEHVARKASSEGVL